MQTASRRFLRRATLVSIALIVHLDGAVAQQAPLADAGLPCYAATDPVQLNATASRDPDAGTLWYAWTQLSGPPVTIADAETPTPTVGGFVQTDVVQECVFELTVTDAEMQSDSAQTRVLIVPDFGAESVELYNDAFNPAKPTMIYFGGGNCTIGNWDFDYGARLSTGHLWKWLDRVNVVWFPNSYGPDSGPGRTYYKYGDMLIVYLWRVAPDYAQPIQTLGWSTGGQPAIDVGIRLNQTYADPRYAVNHVTFLDAVAYCRDYTESVAQYLAGPVAGETCWVENHVASLAENHISGGSPSFPLFHEGVLNVEFERYRATGMGWLSQHLLGNDWLWQSLRNSEAMAFNAGVVAGAYWSVIGPGKNLQLASTPGRHVYHFRWRDDGMEMADEALFPGRLPEPVTLAAWSAGVEPSEGAILSCHPSENAVLYELLLGSQADDLSAYRLVRETATPPMEAVVEFGPEDTFWTVRVRDAYGSTIYADPIPLDLTDLPLPTVENLRTHQIYGLIQHAVLDAQPGDTIVLAPGLYEENVEIDLPVTIRSSLPDDPLVVAETILRGRDASAVVSFSGPGTSAGTLAGLTVESDTLGVWCRDAMPVLRSCVVDVPKGVAVDSWYGRPPTLIDCTLLGEVVESAEPGLIACWLFDEGSGEIALDVAGGHDGLLSGDPVWRSDAGRFAGALHFDGAADAVVVDETVLNPADGPFSIFAWIEGAAPGQTIISQVEGTGWLMADPSRGALMTTLAPPAGRKAVLPLISQVPITDGNWHRIGFVWDGAMRALYVDETRVAEDAQGSLAPCTGGLHIGCDNDQSPDTFFTGLIDDVRIYNRAVTP